MGSKMHRKIPVHPNQEKISKIARTQSGENRVNVKKFDENEVLSDLK